MEPQDVLSILILPVRAAEEWYDIIGFDDTLQGREWDEQDIRLLQTAAEMIGVYIERKRIETALRFTQFSVDHASNAIFWLKQNARFIYVNEATSRLLGYSRSELLSLTVQDINSDFPQEVWKSHWQELKEKGSSRLVSHMRTRNGRVFPVELVINHLEFEGQEYHVIFAQDITDRKEAEETWRRYTAGLEALRRVGLEIAVCIRRQSRTTHPAQ